jgi:hypothetical protein
MEKISRSVRQAKQAKKIDADCTSPYSPYVSDVAGPYDRTKMTWQAMVGWRLTNQEMTRVSLVASGMRTRGPIHGHHVSLIIWLFGYVKTCGGVRGVRPPDLPNAQRLRTTLLPTSHRMVLI